MNAPDWLVLIDDGLPARRQRCPVCGGQEDPRAWFDVWSGEMLAVALVVCGPCRAIDPGRVAVERLL
jgi:hypothetical protein